MTASFSHKTLKLLWGRAAGVCSYTDCRRPLFEDPTETDDTALVGENCHIVSGAEDGPRYDPNFPPEQLDKYDNLILCCRNCHKIIDAQESHYTQERLREMKRVHERWVSDNLTRDSAKQRDDVYYAEILDIWERLGRVDQWVSWTSHLLSNGQPSLPKDVDSDLMELRSSLLTRVWPGRYAPIDAAFRNFRIVLQDLHETFRQHAEPHGDYDLWTRKFYRSDVWDEAAHAERLRRFEFHVDLVQDLAVELTRAANLVCDRIRTHLIPGYRLAQGRMAFETGPNSMLQYERVVAVYPEELKAKSAPYPGLSDFYLERETRDYHFGRGAPD